MKAVHCLLLGTLFVFLTGCVEIIDDLTLNEDGSGTFKYTVNLSSSKIKINSILALDSLDGRKIPSLEEIKARIAEKIMELEDKPGISNVALDANYDDFLFKFSCDFTSLAKLQSAIKEIIKDEAKDQEMPELDHNWVMMEDNKLERSVPKITIAKTRELKQSEKDQLKEGTYTSITRFSQPIERFKNERAVLSKNKMAIMIKTDPLSLIENHHLLDNTIYLTEDEE